MISGNFQIKWMINRCLVVFIVSEVQLNEHLWILPHSRKISSELQHQQLMNNFGLANISHIPFFFFNNGHWITKKIISGSKWRTWTRLKKSQWVWLPGFLFIFVSWKYWTEKCQFFLCQFIPVKYWHSPPFPASVDFEALVGFPFCCLFSALKHTD